MSTPTPPDGLAIAEARALDDLSLLADDDRGAHALARRCSDLLAASDRQMAWAEDRLSAAALLMQASADTIAVLVGLIGRRQASDIGLGASDPRRALRAWETEQVRAAGDQCALIRAELARIYGPAYQPPAEPETRHAH